MSLRSWFIKNFTCPTCGTWDISMFGVCLSEECPSNNPAGAAAPSARQRFPDRRQGVSETVLFKTPGGNEIELEATFNADGAGVIREVFGRIPAYPEGAHMLDFLSQSCIVTSVALQHGATLAELLQVLGEDDPAQPPSTALVAVMRAGAARDATPLEAS